MPNRDPTPRDIARIERHQSVVAYLKAKERRRLTDPPGGDREPVTARAGAIQDSDGRISAAKRRCDAIDQMFSRQTITAAQHEAGVRFRADFERAHTTGLRATDWLTEGIRETGVGYEPMRRVRDEKLEAAVDALGGHGSLLATICWAVIGEAVTLKEWADRQVRPIRHEHASGMLIAALEILTGHYRTNRER